MHKRDYERMAADMTKEGYREGMIRGRDMGLQQGFEQGFVAAFANAYSQGAKLGALETLRLFDPSYDEQARQARANLFAGRPIDFRFDVTPPDLA